MNNLFLENTEKFREVFLDLTSTSYKKLGLIEFTDDGLVNISTSFTGPSLFASKINSKLYLYDSEAYAYSTCKNLGYEMDERAVVRILFSDNLCARPAHLAIFKNLYRCPPGAKIRFSTDSVICSPRFNELSCSKYELLPNILNGMVDEIYTMATAGNQSPRLLFSGGLDSLLIGSIMKSRAQHAVRGFHLLYHGLVSRTTAIVTSLARQLNARITLIESGNAILDQPSTITLKKLLSSGIGGLANIKNYYYYENLSNQTSNENVLLITGQNADTLLCLDHKFPSTQLILWERVIPTLKTISHRYNLYSRSRKLVTDQDQVITCINNLRVNGSSVSISEHGDTSDEFGCYVETFLEKHFNDDYMGFLMANSSQFIGYSELAIEKIIRWYRTCGNVELNYDGYERGMGAERHVFFNHPKFIVYSLNTKLDWKEIVLVKPRFSSLVKEYTGISHRQAVVNAILKFLPTLIKRKFKIAIGQKEKQDSSFFSVNEFIEKEGILEDLYNLIGCISDNKINGRLISILNSIQSGADLSQRDTAVTLKLLNLYFTIGHNAK
jgi:hypothetical protein